MRGRTRELSLGKHMGGGQTELPAIAVAICNGDILACRLRTVLRGWGVKMGSSIHVVLYVDDALVYLQQTEYSVPILLAALATFGGVVVVVR